jgi:alpha-galactosidase
VLYNSWYATEFNVDEAGQEMLADKAANIGVERFVVDDGWFGQRSDDHAGLGDWYVNPTKFPHGLKPLIDHVHSLGMDFGLWVEPEMVNPDSDLYRKHPDWAMHFNGRPRTESRHQFVLNMARDDVKEYTFHWLDALLSNNDIAFLKWDYNRYFTEPGWPEVPVEDQRSLWVKYMQNVYETIDRLRQKYPKLEIETCASGGGRVDLGMLHRTDQAWTSDNTEAFDRLTIQEGFSYAYAPHVMMDWVTDASSGFSVSLKFRFLVAMQGALGVGANLGKWQQEDFALARDMIGYYKSVRATVQNGSLYRLASSRQAEFSASEYVAEDGSQAVLYAFLHSQRLGQPVPRVELRGLEENAVYRIHRIDSKVAGNLETVSGAYLMHAGVELNLEGDYDSTSFSLERIDPR